MAIDARRLGHSAHYRGHHVYPMKMLLVRLHLVPVDVEGTRLTGSLPTLIPHNRGDVVGIEKGRHSLEGSCASIRLSLTLSQKPDKLGYLIQVGFLLHCHH
ncbi:hypothetical protein [Pseudomonas guariconensis]|uniref:hypothetical protein n=1 Tax=Pseudomonas guariconensis TaxID=1288410 RepID=UPI0036F1E813